jgi:hypothetical protein
LSEVAIWLPDVLLTSICPFGSDHCSVCYWDIEKTLQILTTVLFHISYLEVGIYSSKEEEKLESRSLNGLKYSITGDHVENCFVFVQPLRCWDSDEKPNIEESNVGCFWPGIENKSHFHLLK